MAEKRENPGHRARCILARCHAAQVPQPARCVALALLAHEDASRVAWPSQDRLAAECGLNRKTVRASLRSLARAGVLVARQRPRMHAHEYVLVDTAGDPEPRYETIPSRRLAGEDGDTGTPPDGVPAPPSGGVAGTPCMGELVPHRMGNVVPGDGVTDAPSMGYPVPQKSVLKTVEKPAPPEGSGAGVVSSTKDRAADADDGFAQRVRLQTLAAGKLGCRLAPSQHADLEALVRSLRAQGIADPVGLLGAYVAAGGLNWRTRAPTLGWLLDEGGKEFVERVQRAEQWDAAGRPALDAKGEPVPAPARPSPPSRPHPVIARMIAEERGLLTPAQLGAGAREAIAKFGALRTGATPAEARVPVGALVDTLADALTADLPRRDVARKDAAAPPDPADLAERAAIESEPPVEPAVSGHKCAPPPPAPPTTVKPPAPGFVPAGFRFGTGGAR